LPESIFKKGYGVFISQAWNYNPKLIMGHYKANSTNSRSFNLTLDNQSQGELIYEKWYSFNAEIQLNNGLKYQLESKGFWDSKIELKDDTKVLLDFKMGWDGIIIRTFFETNETTYLLKLKGLLSSKFVLIDTDKRELLAAETDFKWKTLNYDYNIETTEELDNLDNKALLLLTTLHCINYYMTIMSA
jgi:hypothetical protein